MNGRNAFFFGCAVLLALAILSCQALAQAGGCGLKELENAHWSCGDGVCYFFICTLGGDPHNFCTVGFGQCCGQNSQSTTVVPDPSCCQPPPQGCDEKFYVWDPVKCTCKGKGGSPIIIDTTGKGFHLTSAADGVVFDISGRGHPLQMAWTDAFSGNGFLVLDRNQNGKVDGGTELFGNFTSQPESDNPNGFLALAVFDQKQNGGNEDGIIDHRDAIFAHLRVWIDENHDGISQASELHPLFDMGIFSLGLKYRESRRIDAFDNQFRYRAAVNPDPGDGESKDGRWAYDIFFATLDTPYVGASHPRSPPRVYTGNHCARDQPLLYDRLDFETTEFGGHRKSAPTQPGNPGGVR